MKKTAQIVDGKSLAEQISKELKEEFEKLPKKSSLEVFWIGSDKSSESFIKIKERFAHFFGVDFILQHYDDSIKQKELEQKLSSSDSDAILIQLPLPKHLNKDKILESLRQEQDVDLLKRESLQNFKQLSEAELENYLMPPVAFAVYSIIKHYKIDCTGKKIVVMGKGKLVGEPVFELFKKLPHGSLQAFDLDSDKKLVKDALNEADIIVSGTGRASLINPEDIKDGVILIDAGTSSQKAKSSLAGDINLACEQKAEIFARTPGGVGPLTVIGLYRNLLILNKNKANQ